MILMKDGGVCTSKKFGLALLPMRKWRNGDNSPVRCCFLLGVRIGKGHFLWVKSVA